MSSRRLVVIAASNATKGLATGLIGVLLVASIAAAQKKHTAALAAGRVTRAELKEAVRTDAEMSKEKKGKSDTKHECPVGLHYAWYIGSDERGQMAVKYTFVFWDARPWPTRTLHFAKGEDEKHGWLNFRVTGKPGQHIEGWVRLKVFYPNDVDSLKSSFDVDCPK